MYALRSILCDGKLRAGCSNVVAASGFTRLFERSWRTEQAQEFDESGAFLPISREDVHAFQGAHAKARRGMCRF